ncbi:MAG: hypothetical protein HUU01_14135 [Saprospiraceae bacterium]|nr:hypothetical protein [Saprospiraceae bacterium]
MRRKLRLLRSQLNESENAGRHFSAGRDDTAMKFYRAVLNAKIDMLLWVLDEEEGCPHSITINTQAA